MTDRLQIEISGELPDDGKYAILASAEEAARKFAGDLATGHGIALTVSVKSVRPGKKSAATPVAVARAAE